MPGDMSNGQEWFAAMTWCLHVSFLLHKGKLAWLFKSPEQLEDNRQEFCYQWLWMRDCDNTEGCWVSWTESDGQVRTSVKLQVWPLALWCVYIRVSKKRWIRVHTALMLSYINYLVLCEGFHFDQKLLSDLYYYPLCPKAHHHAFHVHSCRLFLSFYKLVFCNFLGKKKKKLFLSHLLLDANTRIVTGGN